MVVDTVNVGGPVQVGDPVYIGDVVYVGDAFHLGDAVHVGDAVQVCDAVHVGDDTVNDSSDDQRMKAKRKYKHLSNQFEKPPLFFEGNTIQVFNMNLRQLK